MSEVPSVNQEQKPVPDSEASDKAWVDPIFAEINPERLPDEPEPTAEDIAAQEAEDAAAAEAERKADGQPTKAELKKLIEDLPDDDDPEEGAAKKPDGEAEEADDEADKAAEEAKKKAAEAEGEEADDGAEEAKDGKKPRRRSRARRDRRAMERRLQEKDDEIARLRGQAPQPEPAKAEEVAPQPKLEDFETADEWAAAFGNWTQAQFDAGKEQAARAEQAKRYEAVQKVIEDRINAYEKRVDKFRDIHDDYDEVTGEDNEDLMITPEMAEVIMESELGPQLAYHLGGNPEEAEKIAGLSPLAQAKALAKIETRLEAEQAAAETPEEDPEDEPEEGEEAEEATPKSQPAAAKAPRQTPTKAPEPITTVGGGGAPAKRDTENMSMADYYDGRLSGKIK